MEKGKNKRKVNCVSKASAALLALSMLVAPLAGCTDKYEGPNEVWVDKEGFVWVQDPGFRAEAVCHKDDLESKVLPSFISYMDVVNRTKDVADFSDEISDLGIEMLIENYFQARKECKVEQANLCFSQLALTTVKGKILDELNISMEDIESISIVETSDAEEFKVVIKFNPINKNVQGLIVPEDEGKVKEYIITGSASWIIYDVINSSDKKFSLEELDDSYSSLVNFLCSTANIKNDDTIDFSRDTEMLAKVLYYNEF